ncbi:MAG: hypothetical protein A2519_18845, partial [Candidatus Raymondbacteria bacterium RIFOXYD12_FULL_49_13]
IIAGRHSVVYVWNNLGQLLWRAPVGENASSANDHGSARQYAAPVVGDLDGDGNGEIAIAYSNNVTIYDHTGSQLPNWPHAFPGSTDEIRSITAADLDYNGTLEILVVKTSDGPVTMAWDIAGNAVPGFPQVQGCAECNDYGGYNQNIGACDFDNDARPEVICTYDICHIGIMNPDGTPFAANAMFSDAGPYASSVPMFHDLDLAMQGWGADGNDRDEFTDSPPCFGDMDGDGSPEIILYSDHELAGEYVNRGNCLWVLNPDMTRVAGFETPLCSGMPLYTGYQDNIVQVAPAPAVADVRGDSLPEIIVPSYDGKMRCYTAGGTLAWTYAFDTAGDPFIGASGPVCGDLNNDSLPEIIFTTYSTALNQSHLIILDSQGTELHKVLLNKRGSMSPPTLADVDRDGKFDIVLSLKDVVGSGLGGVQIWDVSSAGNDLPEWPTGRGNNLRNGVGLPTIRNISVEQLAASNPAAQRLTIQCHPNPLQNAGTVTYAVPSKGAVRIAVYDIRGKLIKTLTDANLDQGRYMLEWLPGNERPGIYFLKISLLGQSACCRVLVVP